MRKIYCKGRRHRVSWFARTTTKYIKNEQVVKMLQKGCTTQEGKQTTGDRELQIPSMISKINNEKKFQVKAMRVS